MNKIRTIRPCKFDHKSDLISFIDEELNVNDIRRDQLISEAINHKENYGVFKIVVNINEMI